MASVTGQRSPSKRFYFPSLRGRVAFLVAATVDQSWLERKAGARQLFPSVADFFAFFLGFWRFFLSLLLDFDSAELFRQSRQYRFGIGPGRMHGQRSSSLPSNVPPPFFFIKQKSGNCIKTCFFRFNLSRGK